MRLFTLPLLALTLGACASATGGPPSSGGVPARANTTVSMTGSGGGSTIGSGAALSVSTSPDAGGIAVRIEAPVERAYEALQVVYPQLGITVGTMDPANHLVGNRQIQVTRRLGNRPLSAYLRCGTTAFGGEAADQHRISMSVLSVVRTGQEGSIVETTVQAAATPVGQSNSVACTSSGALEQAIGKAVQLQAVAGPR